MAKKPQVAEYADDDDDLVGNPAHTSDGKKRPNTHDETADLTSYRVTADELRQFVERIERLDAEKKDLAEQTKEVMAEAKGRGYDTKVIRKVVAERKRDADDVSEEAAILEMYREALGM
jgi:uncharacterized protein (UPF0335 family)